MNDEPKSGMALLMANAPTTGEVLAKDLRSIAAILRSSNQPRLADSANKAAEIFEKIASETARR